MAGESVEDVVSTIGFSNYELKVDRFRRDTFGFVNNATPPTGTTIDYRKKGQNGLQNENKENNYDNDEENREKESKPNFRMILYDLGGGHRIRSIWRNYYALVHGVIFVVDSADFNRVLEVKELLEEVISSDKIAGKPILM